MTDFIGVKVALLKDDEVLIIQRDDIPGLRFAGLWDLPGGGRENNETPFECMAREVQEELGLTVSPESIVWEKTYPAAHDPNQTAYFMVATITDDDINSIVFGDEGQGWKMAKIDDFLAETEAVDAQQTRIRDYLATLG